MILAGDVQRSLIAELDYRRANVDALLGLMDRASDLRTGDVERMIQAAFDDIAYIETDLTIYPPARFVWPVQAAAAVQAKINAKR